MLLPMEMACGTGPADALELLPLRSPRGVPASPAARGMDMQTQAQR
jgi:hypothetical protein